MSTSLYTQLGGAVSAADADSYVGCWCDGKMPLEENAGAIGTLDEASFDAIGEARAMCADSTCSDVWKTARTFQWDTFFLGLIFAGGSSPVSTTVASAQDYSCACAVGADNTVGGFPQKLYQAYVDNNIAVCEAAGTCSINQQLGLYCAYDECHDIIGTVADAYNSIDPAWLALMGVTEISGCSSSTDSSLVIIIVVVAGAAVCLCAVVGVVVVMMMKKKTKASSSSPEPVAV